jgi:beta-lactamase regulating signal transducer with metallopeptidase domain
MWSEFQSLPNLGWFTLFTLLASSTTIWIAAVITDKLWQNTSAANRHRLWGTSMLAVLIAPILIPGLPFPRWKTWDRMSTASALSPFSDSTKPERIEPSQIDEVRISNTEKNILKNEVHRSLGEGREHMVAKTFDWTFAINIVLRTWLFGSVVSGVMFLASIWRVGVWRNRALRIESGVLFDRCAALCRHLAIPRSVRIVMSSETVVAAVTGIWRPTILLPAGFGQWTNERLEIVLIHELLHVRRADILWQMIGRLCLVPAWFHPLGWLALRRLRVECEHACDDAVLASGESPFAYATHLVELTQWTQSRSVTLPLSLVAITSQSPIEKRIRAILNPSKMRHPASHRRSICSAFGMASIVLMIASLSPSVSESKPLSSPELALPAVAPRIQLARAPENDLNTLTAIKENEVSTPENDIPVKAGEAVAKPRERDVLLEQVERAIEITGKRTLTANAHSPWQIFHCILAMRQNAVLRLGNERVNAIQWISTAEPQFDKQPWMLSTPDGAAFHPYTRVYAFEGHPGQFVALLSQSNLPREHELHVQGKVVTLDDFVNHLMKTVNTREEMTWVLWALQHYLESDAEWVNGMGDRWSIERLVQIESNAPIVGAPCGGSERLFALTRARNKYLLTGNPLRGVWWQADQKIRLHIQMARALQNTDGSFSSEWYRGPGHTTDVNRRFSTTGHTMEFLAIALPQEELNEPWFQKAVDMLSEELILHRDTKIDCAPLFQSLHALILYRERIREHLN